MHNKTILFTGGGSAGHVTPNLALIEKFRNENWSISYIGSKTGIERELIAKIKIPYFAIATGKLRRYFSWQNFLDPFKILYGLCQSYCLCRKLKPQIVFSKGGFVSFPVVAAAWLLRIPVVIHESDFTPGLANKLSFPFARKICLTFKESLQYFSNKNKLIISGTPLRSELFAGNANQGRKICDFNENKKIILVIGGSLGAQKINQLIRQLLPRLTAKFQIAHICGAGNLDPNYSTPEYKQFTYLKEDLAHLMAACDLVISRAGANSIYELLALKKPHILIPLGTASSRGDQIANAKHFEKLGFSQVIFEENLNEKELLNKVSWVFEHQLEITQKLLQFNAPNSVELIYDVICTELL